MSLIRRQDHRALRGHRAVPALPKAQMVKALTRWQGEDFLLEERGAAAARSHNIYVWSRVHQGVSWSDVADWARRRGWGVLYHGNDIARLTPLFGTPVHPCEQYLYHITQTGNVPRIKRRGLIPQNIWTGRDAGPVPSKEAVRSYPRRVYLVGSLRGAELLMPLLPKRNAIFQVDCTKLRRGTKFYLDPETSSPDASVRVMGVFTPTHIPPEALRLILPLEPTARENVASLVRAQEDAARARKDAARLQMPAAIEQLKRAVETQAGLEVRHLPRWSPDYQKKEKAKDDIRFFVRGLNLKYPQPQKVYYDMVPVEPVTIFSPSKYEKYKENGRIRTVWLVPTPSGLLLYDPVRPAWTTFPDDQYGLVWKLDKWLATTWEPKRWPRSLHREHPEWDPVVPPTGKAMQRVKKALEDQQAAYIAGMHSLRRRGKQPPRETD